MQQKRVVIFGISGVIGQKSMRLLAATNCRLVGLSFYRNWRLAQKIIANHPKIKYFSPLFQNLSNVENYAHLLAQTKPDLVVNAVSGFAGLEITHLCLQQKINLALANKESLVVAGFLIQKWLSQSHTKLFPIDSELSALFDMCQHTKKPIQNLIITASGGAFFGYKPHQLKTVTYAQAIQHPNWQMGAQISLDSATLVNKYMEVVAAFYLFKTNQIQVLRCANSFVHALLHFCDNSYWLHTSAVDMDWAIQSALNGYKNQQAITKGIDWTKCHFVLESLNIQKHLPLQWAYDFLTSQNKAQPIIINAANETTTLLFAKNKIGFHQIIPIIQQCLQRFHTNHIATLHDIYYLHQKVRSYVRSVYG